VSAPGPALIVFCREPLPGEVKTRLVGHFSRAQAAALADAFIADALAKAASLRPSKLVITARAGGDATRSPYFRTLARRYRAEVVDQGSGSLGQRMARALALFAAEGALLIGTDTPSVPREILARCLTMAQRRRVVIAPSLDGGYWAVGVRGAMPPIFSGIRWGGGGVFAATIYRLRAAQVSYTLGPAWYDVDRWSDVMLLGAHLARLGGTRGPHPCPATATLLQRLGVLSREG
jgi:uncharacterized protein